MSLDEATRERITSLIEANDVLLFMKGNREMPQCGFSATVVRILDSLLPAYQTFDVLSDPNLREGIKEYSTWPTIPQLYIKGEFVGGCDIIQELQSSGELAEKLGIELGDVATPAISISDAATDALRQATADAPPDHALHLGIDARYRSSLYLAPVSEGFIEVTANGISIHMDRMTAPRAAGGAHRRRGDPRRTGLPGPPPRSAAAGAAAVGPGAQEPPRRRRALRVRRRAHARGARHREHPGNDAHQRRRGAASGGPAQGHRARLPLPPGDRAPAAAEHFAALGFTNVYTVVGGIDAWSREIDPEVPRY